MEDTLRLTALEKLSTPPSKASLLDLISWLDLECSVSSPDSLPSQILARAAIAAGYELVANQSFPAVLVTIRAAEVYVLEPTEANFDNYFMAATDSYPFGSGDGCYAVPELGYEGCKPGSGCSSGSGSLFNLSIALGADVVMQVIARDLVPWLRGEFDPVTRRLNTQERTQDDRPAR